MLLHWSPRSPFVRKVLIAAHETGIVASLSYRRTVVHPEAPDRDLLRENPLGKLPTLILDDGTAIYDSRVICEYFDSLAPGSLFPATPAARAAALRQQALGDGILDLMLNWLGERGRPPTRQSSALIEANAVKFAAIHERLGAEITELRGRAFDIGHVAIGCALSYLDFRFPFLEWRLRNQDASDWHASFSQRRSVQSCPFVDDSRSPLAQPAPMPASGSNNAELNP